MTAYIFQAALYCEECGDAIRERLIAEGKAPENPDDEYGYDSGDFPKGPFGDGGGEADVPQHCDNRECLLFLENPLTDEGAAFVRARLINRDGDGDVLNEWADFYDWLRPEGWEPIDGSTFGYATDLFAKRPGYLVIQSGAVMFYPSCGGTPIPGAQANFEEEKYARNSA
jgi:hypothetical protein